MRTNWALTFGCMVLVAIFFACATEGNAELAGLPIGHFKINERPDGTINVEARCVETRQILQTLAQRTGKPIVFDKPCNTFTSFWNPKKWSPADEWLDYIAGLSSDSSLVCQVKDGTWQVRGLNRPKGFDASLSDSEILTRYKKANIQATKPSDGVRDGALFLNGVFIEPPYNIVTVDSDSGKSKVLVNGLLWAECSGYRAPVSGQSPSLPASGQLETGDELWQYVNLRLYPQLLNSGISQEEAFREVATFLKSQNIVETVYLKADDPDNRMFIQGPVLVILKGERVEASIFFRNFDLSTGLQRYGSGGVVRTSLEHAAEIAADLAKHLRARQLVVRSSSGAVVTLKGTMLTRFINSLEDSKLQRVEVIECLLSEVIEDRLVCREIAANLPEQQTAMIAVLQNVASKK